MNFHAPLLSLREIQVMRLAAEGLTAKATAKALHISGSAVNLYLTNARHKLGAKTKAEAIAMLIEAGPFLRESMEQLRENPGEVSAEQREHVEEVQFISRQLRHLLDDMSIAEFTQKTQHGDDSVWTELAERFLRTAASALGYGIVKHQESKWQDHGRLMHHAESAPAVGASVGGSPKRPLWDHTLHHGGTCGLESDNCSRPSDPATVAIADTHQQVPRTHTKLVL